MLRFLLLCAWPALALATPTTLQVQGRLIDNFGEPIVGPHNVRVKLYDAGGTSHFSEPFDVNLQDGYFNVTLGASTTTLDSTVFTVHHAYDVEYVIDTTQVLSPRHNVSSAPIAQQAETSERLDRLMEVLIPSSCPAGMALVDLGDEMTYCIDQSRRAGGQYEDAMVVCANAGMHVCTSREWYVAARQNIDNSGSLGLNDMCNGSWAWEWTGTRDQANNDGYLQVLRGGNSSNCQTKTWEWTGQHNRYAPNYGYRCCRGVLSSLGELTMWLLLIASASADPATDTARLLEYFVPSSCPADMVLAGVPDSESAFCIEPTRRTGTQYEDAAQTCTTLGRHVCTSDEWYIAARQNLDNSGSLGLTDMCNGTWAWEWTSTRDQSTLDGYLHVMRGGNASNCQTKTWEWTGQHNRYAPNSGYRCCKGGVFRLREGD